MTREELMKLHYDNNHKVIKGIKYKLCTNPKHNKFLPMNLDNFYKQSATPDGFSSWCKQCKLDYQNEYREINREQVLEGKKQWNYKNKEKVNRRSRDWAKENPERNKQNIKNWYEDNPGKSRQYNKNHRIHDITKTEWEKELEVFDNKCAYCGTSEEENKLKYKERLHKDHADHEGYNDLRNAIPACTICNSYKWQYDMEEWFRKQKFFTEKRLKFILWWTTEGYKGYIENKPPYWILRKHNEDKRTYHFELWTVDEMRNLVECIKTGNKKKDVIPIS